ncbi:MAG: hypothetical protein V1775_15910 [Bacteroidota bacterium]
MGAPLEWILTNTYKTDLIAWMTAHPEAFEETIILSLSDNQPCAWRAAWLLWSCMEKNDPRVQPFVADMINSLAGKNDDHQRELLIILRKMEIPEESEGLLFNHCTNVWEKVGKKPAVRLNAFKIMVKIAGKHPELHHELILLTQPQYMDSLSVVANKSIALLLKRLSS